VSCPSCLPILEPVSATLPLVKAELSKNPPQVATPNPPSVATPGMPQVVPPRQPQPPL
jgi:hypothetical protein